MKIVVPYVDLRDETVEALSAHAGGHDIHYVDVSDSDAAMWETWQWVWEAREDVLWVEHDIEIHEHVIPQVSECPEPWCTFAYPYAFGNSDPYHGTGCVRVRAELMRAVPDLWRRVAARSGPHHPEKHWCSLDGFMQIELSPNYVQHKHDPPVGHVDVANSHGCLGTF